ncbi:MAG: lamin tail domain-containing protein, partial [Phycisphaerae bacterium]|nr:lamin tail domain-containing protein [Phycisphaerae bacterium]
MLLDAIPLITEFMAINDTTLADENTDYSDWLEVHNAGDVSMNLDGWYLTDDAGDLTKWQFPSRTLNAGDYLVIFASDKDRTGAELHTNFKLSGGGEYLALV